MDYFFWEVVQCQNPQFLVCVEVDHFGGEIRSLLRRRNIFSFDREPRCKVEKRVGKEFGNLPVSFSDVTSLKVETAHRCQLKVAVARHKHGIEEIFRGLRKRIREFGRPSSAVGGR